MTPLQEEVRLAVQAALLNSECAPVAAVEAAIEALVEFHLSETDEGWSQLSEMLARVYEPLEKSIRA